MLGYSRQVYYRALKAEKSSRQKAEKVVGLVQSIRQKLPRIGTRKLYYLLEEELCELNVGRDKLFAILKANQLLVKPSRSYHITTNSYHRFRKHKNQIEHLEIIHPEQVWVADITYVGTRSNPLYLALITDAYSKKIVGYDLSDSLSASGSVNALTRALKSRQYPEHALIHHSDRGLQYCCNEYQKVLIKHGIRCSMTESYDPYANAVAERVNGILKHEFLYLYKPTALIVMRKLIREMVEKYNQLRPHLSCQMLTPQQMHNQKIIRLKTYKSKNLSKASLAEV